LGEGAWIRDKKSAVIVLNNNILEIERGRARDGRTRTGKFSQSNTRRVARWEKFRSKIDKA